MTCGTVTGEFAHLMDGGEGDITVPIPVFLIKHPREERCSTPGSIPIASTILLDDSVSGSPALFRIGFQPGEEVSARLEAIDRDPGKIDLIINSHFPF